ncbi:uncharacterized protein LOC126376841 [Pectinophora gossypiella]|nr:uncharacterized protein LOC126376841 [Pectinophora gossypiella]
MSTQGGLKHAATEPSHLDNKRETRRRGAAGRAAALRRAPSDSDCSGETASLSADSADRVRPAPPPPRQTKTRSRRRGSEWEVLEGLKDGQRFERRPEVFNGYLHKKRKWPLKGWHKRFFVVDGGILVYARSPTDVARGRLHGSVDVGLSVISAKARRRRIDIDADEFIYHLRAKTADVFRTWLNVLKAHRLYRQHLLTFGARESVPKIHAPLDDLPQTDTSSPQGSTSSSSEISTSELSGEEDIDMFLKEPDSDVTPVYSQNIECPNNSGSLWNANESLIQNWHSDSLEHNELIPLSFEPLEDCFVCLQPTMHHSLCSMQCMAKRYENEFLTFNKSAYDSINVTEAEKQVDSTDLEKNSLKYTETVSPAFDHSVDYYTSSKEKNITSVYPVFTEMNDFSRIKVDVNSNPYFEKNIKPMTTLFLFGRKKKLPRSNSPFSLMKRSKKSTNLVKYRNIADEPPLKKPLSKSMLLNKCKDKKEFPDRRKVNKQVSADTEMENKSLQDTTTASEFDKITERLITSIFHARSNLPTTSQFDSKTCINQIVQQLYDIKWSKVEVNPAKILFRCLLEYWLKNSSMENIRNAITCVKSTDTRSNQNYTADEKLSCILVRNVNKQTQFNGIINNATVRIARSPDKQAKRPRNIPYSYMKERRIQELEKLLKNTVYTCETLCNTKSKEKDIEITKKLIHNLDHPKGANLNSPDVRDNSNSSTEFPEIQDTFNHLISETSIPPSVAKEFLGAYLDVLLSDHTNNSTNNTSSSDDSKPSQELPVCEVLTEAVQKKVSKGILTADKKESTRPRNQIIDVEQDPGQKYLKDVLDKITRMFSKVKTSQDKDVQPDDTKVEGPYKADIRRTEYPVKNLITENIEENSVVIDLTKFDLDHISMFHDPAVEGVMSINIKLKERPPNYRESKQKNLNLKFCEDKSKHLTCPDRFNPTHSSTRNFYRNDMDPRLSFKNPYIDFDPNIHRDKIDLKPYLSTSDATSKAYRILYESQHSIDSKKSFDCQDDVSCYLLSSIKKNVLTSPFTSKKKVRVSECNGIIISPREQTSRPGSARRTELSVIERAAPRIIDEKFILLLLENLTMLSQNIPGLHKDISGLYTKLKKRHEREVKVSPNAGLGLLGKIYNDDNKQIGDSETQYDMTMFPEKPLAIRSLTEIGLNTSKNFKPIDKCTSGIIIRTSILKDIDVQTTDKVPKKRKRSVNFIDAETSTKELEVSGSDHDTLPDKGSVLTVDTAVSSPNWFQLMYTKDCGISTVIKCLLDDKGSTHNFRICSEDDKRPRQRPKNPANMRQSLDFKGSCHDFRIRPNKEEKSKGERKQWSKATEDINFQEPSQSQAEKRYSPHMKERKIKRDFNVYQLFVSRRFQQCNSARMSSYERDRSDDMKTIYRCHSNPSYCSGLVSPTSPPLRGPQAGFVSGTPGGRLASWIIESGGPLENASRELGQAQLSVQQLQRLLDALELQHQHHDTDVSLEGASPNVKKDRRKFGLRKKKSSSKCASVELAPPLHVDASASHMALSALTAPPSPGGGASSVPNSAASLPIACAAARPQSLPGAEALSAAAPASLSSLTPDHQLREDFTVLAKDLVGTLKGVVSTLVVERGRLRAAVESAEGAEGAGGAAPGGVLAALRTNLSSALHQNSELRSRLSRIHDASDLAEISSVNNSDPVRPFPQSLSYSSSCVSASEFFDAEEHDPPPDDMLPNDEVTAIPHDAGVIELDGDSSSEAGSLSSEEGSASSDNSDGALAPGSRASLRHNGCAGGWLRRTRLPCPRPTPGGPSLWNLLYKNIGKDLSQVSMPVTINEPLNMLQRLCEELEYSELLDAAAECASAMERMSLVAAFAVSAYAASAHRAASKPFNPLLAETYECVRTDKGFRFLAEQVSHHPPISACHAESPRWCFWQEARIKTKFWGKSMEFQPAGRVHVRLLPAGDHYSWNKVTTCVHNLFGGQRWVDQYGDMHITCHGTEITAKLNFIKASSWSSSRHEVRGMITDGSTGGRLRLQGRWSEALYAGDPPAARCLWRPGAMPPDHELYYGFTRFAMELNEMEPGLRELLPHTDTRLRPDQRALEEGDVEAAEQFKHELEQAQRERRRDSTDHSACWFRKSVEGGEEMWMFTGEYWKAREAGFSHHAAPRIW